MKSDKHRRQVRHAVALGALAVGVVLVGCPRASALNPALDISQYAHTSWKIRDGFFKGAINSIAQTPDGYLWLGTEIGLLRFDGVRADPWQPPDQQLPSNQIWSLLATRDGTLWIGTSKGLASWKDGKLTHYAELDGQIVGALLEDREGSVWVGGSAVPSGRLCAIQGGTVQSYGQDGGLGLGVVGLYEDSKGHLWAGARNGLWQWKPGPPKFYPFPGEPNAIRGLGEDYDGALLIGMSDGVRRFVDGKTQAYPLGRPVQRFDALGSLRDRNGSLWIGTAERGLVHLHEGRTDLFAQSDSLTGDFVTSLLEDREGSIWVATLDGLDRFRDFSVATFRVSEGLLNARVGSVLADTDGSVWLGTPGGLNRWNSGQITIPPTGGGRQEGKLNGLYPNSLFQDDRGRVWVSTQAGIGYLENDRFTSVSGVPGGSVHGIVEDNQGNLWIANQNFGLFRLSRQNEIQQIPWSSLGHKDFATALAADPLLGGLWLGFVQGGVAYWKDGQVRASYTAADGLGEGRVNSFLLDRDSTVWAATEGGFSRLKNGRVATLASKNGLPCDAVHWVIEDAAHSFWLYTPCGLVRIARPELDAWADEADKNKDTKPTINPTVFDSSDGVRSQADPGGFRPRVAISSDGKLWFGSYDGVSVVDPSRLPFNGLPPPVHIEQIIADRKTYGVASAANGPLPLPALIRDLEIDYTALSLVAPEKVLFRYKLEGWESDWQDAGNRREAFYTNLPPRSYRFRVMACNNSGVWNDAGAFLDFSIAPAYYQTTLFRLSCVAAFLLLMVALYQLRARQIARQFNMRMEERVAERTRIARDFHDTLLQSFQGALLKFHAVTYVLPDGSEEARKRLGGAIKQAEEALAEGRDAVQGLRDSTVVANDLVCAISALAEELGAQQPGETRPGFRVHVEGESRDLAPLVRDDVNRIAGEALRNAFRHAQARRIEVDIDYDPRQLRLRIRDDGKGIDSKLLEGGARAGHYGLPGMRERAGLIGGKLAVWSEIDSGTEVELTIPGRIAYAKSPATRTFASLWKRAG